MKTFKKSEKIAIADSTLNFLPDESLFVIFNFIIKILKTNLSIKVNV